MFVFLIIIGVILLLALFTPIFYITWYYVDQAYSKTKQPYYWEKRWMPRDACYEYFIYFKGTFVIIVKSIQEADYKVYEYNQKYKEAKKKEKG